MRTGGSCGYSEDLRQFEHLAPVAFAFLIRYLTWRQALLLALVAVAYAFVSPRLWPATRRPEEERELFSGGKVAYAVAVFLLVLLFPERKFIVVAVWANLSVGDAVSNLAGRKFGRARLPWNGNKTWIGMSAAAVASTAAGWALIAWTGLPPGHAGRAFWYALAAALVCSAVETLPAPVDDNLTICASGAAFLAWFSAASLPGAVVFPRLALGLAVSAGVGALAFAARAVSAGGFLAGALMGAAVFYAFGAAGFVLLGAFFVLGTLFTRLGYAAKMRLGAAQPHRSQRRAAHVWGKGLAALLAAVGSIFLQDKATCAVAFVAALSASMYDTTATELGLLAGGRPLLLTTLRRVAPGTRGAVSVAGSLLGLLGAAAIAAGGYFLALAGVLGAAQAVAAATVAAHLESWLAARPQGSVVSGPMMNAFHTVAAMLLAAVFAAAGAK